MLTSRSSSIRRTRYELARSSLLIGLCRELTPIAIIYLLIDLVGGKGGNASCTVAPEAVRLASGSSRPLDKSAALTYPLKPSYAGVPGYIPLRETDGWTCLTIETSYRLP